MNNYEIQQSIGKYLFEHPETKIMDTAEIIKNWSSVNNVVISDPVFMFDILNIIDKAKLLERDVLSLAIE